MVVSNTSTSTQGAWECRQKTLLNSDAFCSTSGAVFGAATWLAVLAQTSLWGVSFSPQPAWLLSRCTSFLPVRDCSGWWWMVSPLIGWLDERMGGCRVNSRRMRSWHVFKKINKKSHNQPPERVWFGSWVKSTQQSCQIASSCDSFVNCLLTIERDFKLTRQWKIKH